MQPGGVQRRGLQLLLLAPILLGISLLLPPAPRHLMPRTRGPVGAPSLGLVVQKRLYAGSLWPLGMIPAANTIYGLRIALRAAVRIAQRRGATGMTACSSCVVSSYVWFAVLSC